MLIRKVNNTVEFVTETKFEFNFMKKFPGTLKRSQGYNWAPFKKLIIKNLIKRIQTDYPKRGCKPIRLCPSVSELIKGPIKLKEIPESFKFYTQPYKHQEIALRFAYTCGSAGLLLDPGLGKTKVILDYAALVKKKMVIVCPKALLFVWEDECKFHRPDLSTYVVKSGTWKSRLRTLEDKVFPEEKTRDGIIKDNEKRALNPRTPVYDVEERLSVVKERWEKKRVKDINMLIRGMEEDERRIKETDIVVVNYDKAVDLVHTLSNLRAGILAIDEGLIKNPNTNRTKALTRLSLHFEDRFIASGTLVNNTVLDVYSPIRFLEPSLVGNSYFNFRERFCKMQMNYATKNKFVAGFKDIDMVRGILEACSIVMHKDQWLDVPDKVFIPKYVDMPIEQEQHYFSLVCNYITKLNDEYVEVDSPLTAMSKLTQITNGFIYCYKEDDKTVRTNLFPSFEKEKVEKIRGERRVHFFKENPKIEKFRELIRSKDDLKNCKYIVWYNMASELDLITKLLEEESVTYSVIKGGEKHTGDKVRTYNRDPSIQVLVCQAKSVNYGITVLGTDPEKLEEDGIEVLPDIDTNVYTHVFYSMGYSLEMYIQQQDRSHRIGQKNNPRYYLLLMRNPTDENIMMAMDNKMDLRGKVLVDVFNKIRKDAIEEKK